MRKEKLYQRIIEAATAAGAEARQTQTAAGTLYFDGEQHGEVYDIVFISVSRYSFGHYNGDAATIAKEARKAAGRFKGVTIKEIEHPGFYVYEVFTAEDAERAEKLRAEANIFLEAFHEERHRQRVAGEPDDAQKAAKAGRDAIMEATRSRATA